MIDFDLKPYEWKMNMDNIMSNVNLSKIEFLNDRSILFCFLNSYNGSFYKKIICHNVLKFTEDNYYEKSDGFPFFICDVKLTKLKNTDIENAFNYLRYGMNIPDCQEYNLLCMDSGELSINLICGIVEIID